MNQLTGNPKLPGELHPGCNKKKITAPFLDKYELITVICERAKQISMSNIKSLNNTTNCPTQIALEEIYSRTLDYAIRRTLPDDTFEYWHINDLHLPEKPIL